VSFFFCLNPFKSLQAGIGTYFAPGFVRPFYRSVAQLADQAFAWYLSEHVIGGYKFLMQNYDYGDKVCIFGPSGEHHSPAAKRLICGDLIGRLLSWRLHCPSARGNVAQGMPRIH
jgi:hypothetical protein